MMRRAVFTVILLSCCRPVSAELIGYWPFDGSPEAAIGEEGFEVNGPIDVSR